MRGAEESAATSTARLPDFLVIGAAKAGTTTIYEHLRADDRVFVTEPKSPEFFSRDANWERGVEWYASLFAAAGDGQLCGEASPGYTHWPTFDHVPQRIASVVPDCRFVYLLREPVSRAYSHYAWHMRHGVTMTFEEALEQNPIYLDAGRYLDQIEQYLEVFPRERLLVVLFDDLRRDPQAVMDDIYGLLELEPRPISRADRVANRSNRVARARTAGRVRRVPGVSAALRVLPPSVKDRGYRLVQRSPLGRRWERGLHVAPLADETRQRLQEYYRRPNEELAEFLGRDLSEWS